MVDQYNKKVTSANRGMGEEIFRRADNINDVIKYSELDETPGDFYLHREYAKYVSKYIKSLKND